MKVIDHNAFFIHVINLNSYLRRVVNKTLRN